MDDDRCVCLSEFVPQIGVCEHGCVHRCCYGEWVFRSDKEKAAAEYQQDDWRWL